MAFCLLSIHRLFRCFSILLSVLSCQSFLPAIDPLRYRRSDALSLGAIVPQRINSLSEFQRAIESGVKIENMDVRGNLPPRDPIHPHPVLELLHSRKKYGRSVDDKFKLAVSVEGGGMRGCVSAGMMTALWYLGLSDSVDVIYGSSAGALIGAYFLADQLPHEGPEIYYKLLTSAGDAFIDKKALLRSCGLGLLDLRWKSLVSLVADHLGPPALDLDFLLQEIVGRRSPLNWERFWEKQQRTPLKVVVSGLLSRRSVALSAADGHFQSLEELCRCLKASMLLPGLSGPPVQLRGRQAESPSLLHANWTERSGRFFSRGRTFFGSEPFVDAQLFEPIPLRSAERDGCSHILVLRTRADGQRLTRPMSLLERTMLRRYFSRKLGLPQLADYMLRLGHRAVYAEDVLRLNEASADLSAASASLGPKLLAVALPPGTKEVDRLESSARVILENVREGFAAAHDALVAEADQIGQGRRIAETIWPSSLLAPPTAGPC